ncbi:MAG: nucleotidyltransferase [Prochlorococcus sp. SP3034]|nr:nucleotidyltransferase [Prochlorococcus sp. SP3034]|tara:strand:- start:3921 stop:5192 length:1272 start_codon:yes stop_codon:yes gene_type:complete
MEAIALIDGNNFYASCEQSINPSLRKKPLVILSNNDGCIIARSAEARALGIKMGTPYFKAKKRLNQLGVIVLSSNYSLYGDMSKRLMNLLKKHCEKIEIYSIDEAFVSISRPKDNNLYRWARQLRAFIYQNLGITITIGIGENKVRAKLANKLAKEIDQSSGIFDLANIKNKDNYFKRFRVEDIWGVGNQTSKWLRSKGIKNANEFKEMDEYEVTKKLGVVGKRIQLELKGYKCLSIENIKTQKKEIRVSRSFGKPITRLEDLTQALAIYAITASEKMRLQNLQTSTITIFTRTSHYSNYHYQKSAYKNLVEPTNNTNIILNIVLELAKEIYNREYKLAKAGVLMQNLTSYNYLQKSIHNSFSEEKLLKENNLIKTIDYLNSKFNNKAVSWGIIQRTQNWEMNKNLLSGTSTTNIDKIPTIII